MPESGELSHQNTKDRYHGVNDPVALNLLKKAGQLSALEPREDESIRTLYVGGIQAHITEQDIRDSFYIHGDIESVKIISQRGCAFVIYTTRQDAEKAAEELSNKLVIKGLRMKLLWGRSCVTKPKTGEARHLQQASVVQNNVWPHDQYPSVPYYSSMDPQRTGALIPTPVSFPLADNTLSHH